MFNLFGASDYSLVGERIASNSKQAVEALFSRHYNVKSVTKDHWTDDYYSVKLMDGRYLTVRTVTGYTMFNEPYTCIRSVSSI